MDSDPASNRPGPVVEVWRWSLDEPRATVNRLLATLSPDERERAARFARDEVARRHTVARGRLRELLARRLQSRPEELVFRYGPMGKPEVDGPGREPCCFNLAHSGEAALCAVSDTPVGIDLERVRPLRDCAGLARRWFSADETRRIGSVEQDARLEAFFRVWTAKEAALKLVGLGVGESLPRLQTPPSPDGGEATGLPANALGLASCWVQPLVVDGPCVAALATPAPPAEVVFRSL